MSRDQPTTATSPQDHHQGPHHLQEHPDNDTGRNGANLIDTTWRLLNENMLAKLIIAALQSYVSTMRELIENTLKEDFIPVFRHEDVIVVMTAILGFLGFFIAFTCIRGFCRLCLWVILGPRCESSVKSGAPNNGQLYGGANSNNNHRRDESEHAPARKRLPESRRWLRQATCDLESARNDFDGDNPAPEWVCYKCQQALEKALKAYIISDHRSSTTNQANLMSHDLCDLAALTNHIELMAIACQLQGICGLSPRMRYPDFLPFPQIPRDTYSLEEAITAHRLTGVALDIVHCHFDDSTEALTSRS